MAPLSYCRFRTWYCHGLVMINLSSRSICLKREVNRTNRFWTSPYTTFWKCNYSCRFPTPFPFPSSISNNTSRLNDFSHLTSLCTGSELTDRRRGFVP